MSSTPPHQALYRRWRAQTFSQIVGQEPVVETLRNAVRSNQVAHALLFVGPRGTGKTSMARIVAKALNCTNLQDGDPCDRCEACVAIREGRALDVTEMDAASNNRVDDMRELLERTYTAPSDLRRKVYIVDEVQRITQGWDVLLRTLEEPPDHVAFIFCTTDASQIRPAVLSRVQRFDFRRLSVPEIEGKLSMILTASGRAAEPAAVTLIARIAAGGMRDAESILDQLLSAGTDTLHAAQVRELLGLADVETIERFVAALVDGDALAGIAVLDGLEERGRDLRAFLDQIVDALRSAMVAGLRGPAAPGSRVQLDGLARASRRLAQIDAARGAPGGLRFQIELALLDAAEPGTGSLAETAAVRPSDLAEVVRSKPGQRPQGDAGAEAKATTSPSSTLNRHSASAEPPPVTALPDMPARAAVEPPVSARVDTASARVDTASANVGPESAKVEPAAPAEVKPVATATLDSDPLDELRRKWPEVVALISQHPPTKPLIAACRPISVEGNIVTLGFPEGQAFLKDVAERRRTILEEGVGKLLGRPVAVRCVATNLDLVPPLPTDDEASKLLAEARRIFADDLAEVGEIT